MKRLNSYNCRKTGVGRDSLRSSRPNLCSALGHLQSCSSAGNLPAQWRGKMPARPGCAWCLPKHARKPFEAMLSVTAARPGRLPTVFQRRPPRPTAWQRSQASLIFYPGRSNPAKSGIWLPSLLGTTSTVISRFCLYMRVSQKRSIIAPKLWKINRGRNCTAHFSTPTGFSNSDRSNFILKRKPKGIFCTTEQLQPWPMCSDAVVGNLCIKNFLVNPSFVESLPIAHTDGESVFEQ